MSAATSKGLSECGCITKTIGRYNLLDNKRTWRVAVLAPDGKWLSAHWAEDDEPEIFLSAPSEVVELIAKQNAKLWVDTARKEKEERAALCRTHASVMNRNWATVEIKRVQSEMARKYRHIAELRNSYLTEEA